MNSKFEEPHNIKNLVIIESPGKIPSLTQALRRSRVGSFHILATGGHLYDLPDSLDDIGIDINLIEYARRPKRPASIQAIKDWSTRAERVLIACDADQEGDVLAFDIAHLLSGLQHANIQRVRLRSLDVEGVLHAFSHPEPVRARDAWPGTARRMLDRLIGAAYSMRDDGNAVELSVGRVQSALLGAAARENIPFAQAQIVLPACDGRDPFVATLPVYAHNEAEIRELVERAQEFAESGQCVPFGKAVPAADFKPWTYGEAVLAVAEATDRAVGGVAKSMQRLYEAGRLSYPRSTASAVTAQAVAVTQALAADHGVRFDAGRVAKFARQGRHAHESPRLLTSQVDISAPLLVMSEDDATLSLIARQLLSCGQPHAVHKPDPSCLPDWASGLKFERKVCQWLRPWPRRQAVSSIRTFPKEELAFRLLLKHKLGRPSTLVFHALKFASRQLLDEHAKLTEKGHEWLSKTPAVLRDPKTSAQIEQIIDACVDAPTAEPPSQMVKTLLATVSLWGDVDRALQRNMRHSPSGLDMRYGSAEDRGDE